MSDDLPEITDQEFYGVVVPELEELMRDHPWQTWSERDLQVLRRYYGLVDMKELASYLNRTVSAIQSKAYKLGIDARSRRME